MGRILQFRTRAAFGGAAGEATEARRDTRWLATARQPLSLHDGDEDRRIAHRRRMLTFLAVSAARQAAHASHT
jgi:hypothetical protein